MNYAKHASCHGGLHAQFLPFDMELHCKWLGWVLNPATQRTMLTGEDLQPTQ